MANEREYTKKQQEIMLNSVYRVCNKEYDGTPDEVCVPYKFEVYQGRNCGITGRWYNAESGEMVEAIGHWNWGQITVNNFPVEDSKRLRALVPKNSELVRALDEKGYKREVPKGTRINDLLGTK